MDAIDAQTQVQESAVKVLLGTAACCCPECCADEQAVSGETPCC